MLEADARPVLERADLSSLPSDEREARARELALHEARRPFDLSRAPLVRAMLIAIGAREHVFVLTVHHIAADGWSMGILLRELSALYTEAIGGPPARLASPGIAFADLAARQRTARSSEAIERGLAFWRGELDGAPQVIQLPTDRPRPSVQTDRGRSLELASAARARPERSRS